MTSYFRLVAPIGALLLVAGCGGTEDPGPTGDGGVRDAAAPDDDGGRPGDDGGALGSDGGPPADGGADAGSPADAGPGSPGVAPDEMGPYDVSTMDGTSESTGRSVPVFAHVPSGVSGPVPLVLVHPGFQVRSDAYGALCDHVASHGFVVVRAEPPSNYSLFGSSHVEGAEDFAGAIDWALAEHGDAVDASRIAVAGHSAGGKIATMVARDDPRVTALVALDPVNGAGGPGSGYSADRPDVVPDYVAPLSMPVGFLGETNDASGGFMPCAPADQNYQTFYEAATSASWAAEWTFEDGRHMDFLTGPGSCGSACFACGQGDAAEQVAAGATAIVTAFVRRHLGGEAAMEAWLTGASVPGGVGVRSR